MPSYIKLAMGAGVIVVLAGVILWNYPASDAHKTDQIPMDVGNKPNPATGSGAQGGNTPRTTPGTNPRTATPGGSAAQPPSSATPRTTTNRPERASPSIGAPGDPTASPARSPVQTPPLGGSAVPSTSGSPGPTTTAPVLRSEPPIVIRHESEPDSPSSHAGAASTQPATPPISTGDTRPAADSTISTPPRDPAAGANIPVVRPDPTPPPPSSAAPASATPSTPIRSGETPIRTESSPPPRSEPTRLPVGKRYVIQEGDMLASIARDEYGAEKYWTAIVEANPGLDPARLRVGQAINLPPRDAVLKRVATPGVSPARSETTSPRDSATPSATTAAPSGSATPTVAARRYTVAKGDTLMSIARRILKDDGRWREIYELNRDKLSSPDSIKVGMELKLPVERAGTSATPSRGDTTRTPDRRPVARPAGSPR